MSNYITDIDILDESKESFLVYAEEVLTDRAIPSAEDGLLSVHRKLIWTMENILKMSNKSKYKKSGSIVGSTLASSYYHGDSACYGALCKLAQLYLMRYPLVDGDGNLGTQEGNGMEASARYTNARPSKYADLMYVDYNKNVVPLKPTYNEEYMEPVVLPSLLPNAICNGREAIGIGFSHNSLPANLSEVCDAIIAYLKNNDITIDEILEIMPGPDFPLGGVVVNTQDVKEAYRTGHSSTSIKVRGDYVIEGQNIIFNSIPYRTYRNKIKEQINKNIDELDKIIDDFKDESNVGVNKLVFHCKVGVNPSKAVEVLFDCTDLQTSLSYNMNFIVNGTPKLCSMKQLIEAYVNHQMTIIIAAAIYDKNKAEKRKHIIEGLLIAIGDINKALELIKSSANKEEATKKLTSHFDIDDVQATAILDMKLSVLTKMDKSKLEKELKEKIDIIKKCNKLIEDKSYRTSHLIEKVSKMKKEYGDARRTKLLYNKIEKKTKVKEKEVIEPKPCVVVLTQNNDIKRLETSSFRVQHRNGVGIKNSNDITLYMLKSNTTHNLLLFSEKGKFYSISVNDIPTGTNKSKGVSIYSLINMDASDRIIAAIDPDNRGVNKYVLFATKQGVVKKTKIDEYISTRNNKKGSIAIKLRENDNIQSINFINDERVLIATHKGFGLCFKSEEIRITSKNSIGVKGINLSPDDYVISTIPAKKTDKIAVFTEDGTGKRVEMAEFNIYSRGGKGVKIIYNTNLLASVIKVDNNDNIVVIGDKNSICIESKDIPVSSRTSKGVNIIKNNKIVKCFPI